MDGNGRWANKHGRKRTYGHYIGSLIIDNIIKAAVKLGIKYLTLYAFSTENWKRPKSEIRFLMSLFKVYLKKKEKLFNDNGVRFRVIGDLDVFDKETNNMIVKLEQKTKNNTSICLVLALNYGGKHEIVQAAKKMIKDVVDGELKAENINDEVFRGYLYTDGMPDVDLLIRTGGEKRLSNFLLWQSSYAEFVFLDKYWPEFTPDDLKKAVDEFNKRQRKFGGV